MKKYKASDYFMTRTPLFSLQDYNNMFDQKENFNLEDIVGNHVIVEAIKVCSNDFFRAIIRNNSIYTEKFYISLIKYLIRLCTRPTPFGLFAGVSFGQYGAENSIIVSDISAHKKRARPDMEWIYSVIKILENDPSIRKKLRYRFNDFTYINGNRLVKPINSYLQNIEKNLNGIKNEGTSIKYTRLVKIVEEICDSFVSYSNIVDELVKRIKNAPRFQIESFIDTLLDNEFLLSELRPPLTNTNILDYIINILSKISESESSRKILLDLKQIRQLIHQYSDCKIGYGLLIYDNLTKKMCKIARSKNYLQVDMKISTNTNKLSWTVKEQLEQFVEAMHKISPFSFQTYEMVQYTNVFNEKYGNSTLVPVLDLIEDMEETKKLVKEKSHQNAQNYEKLLVSLIDQKIIFALKGGEDTISITDADVDYIYSQKPHKYNPCIQQSFELFLIVHPDNALENSYRFTISPAIGSRGIGKAFGRFRTLFNDNENLLISKDIKKIACRSELIEDSIWVELTEVTNPGRTNNVSINVSDYCYNMALETNPDSRKMNISIRDLYIGYDSIKNHLYIWCKSLNKRIKIASSSMMNPALGCEISRFLQEISSISYENPIHSIITIIKDRYVYCPRITYRTIIIKPQTWMISVKILGLEAINYKEFENQFKLFSKKYKIPTHVFLCEYDMRLLLNLENKYHKMLIYNMLVKKQHNAIILTEAEYLYKKGLAQNSNNDTYMTEIIVPFMYNEQDIDMQLHNTINDIPHTKSSIYKNLCLLNTSRNKLLPGEKNWIFIKLYGNYKRKYELLSFLLDKIKTNSNIIEKFFYINYADPHKHVRVRICFKNGFYEKGVCDFLNYVRQGKNDGLLSKITIDTYERETGRYGGLNLIELAESYFYFDSCLALEIITRLRYGTQAVDIDRIGIRYVISVLKAFCVSNEMITGFLETMINHKDYRAEFNKSRKKYMQDVDLENKLLVTSCEEPYEEIYAMIKDTTEKLRTYVEAIYSIDSQGLLTNSISNIIRSIIHMFCNRIGMEIEWEKKLYALTCHSFYSLKKFLANFKK